MRRRNFFKWLGFGAAAFTFDEIPKIEAKRPVSIPAPIVSKQTPMVTSVGMVSVATAVTVAYPNYRWIDEA